MEEDRDTFDVDYPAFLGGKARVAMTPKEGAVNRILKEFSYVGVPQTSAERYRADLMEMKNVENMNPLLLAIAMEFYHKRRGNVDPHLVDLSLDKLDEIFPILREEADKYLEKFKLVREGERNSKSRESLLPKLALDLYIQLAVIKDFYIEKYEDDEEEEEEVEEESRAPQGSVEESVEWE